MKQKIEKYLGGRIYTTVAIFLSLLIWSYRYFIPEDNLMAISFYSMFLLTIPFFIISIAYKNTVYTIPIILGLLFSLGIPNMGLDTFDLALVGFLNVFLIILGMLIHLIKYKVTLKLKTLGVSLILVSISFILPELSKAFVPVGFMLSLLGLLYLFIYLYYANTIEGNWLHYLMRTFMLLGLMLTGQLFLMWYDGYLVWEGTDFILEFTSMFNLGTGSIPGWGNINDLTLHVVLFSSSLIYYLFKYPKSIWPWLYIVFISFWIYVSNARGSMVTVTIFVTGAVVYAIFKRDKRQLINLLVSTLITSVIVLIFLPTVQEIWDSFFETIDFEDPDSMLTGRLTLWFYHENSAWHTFLRHPVVGSGWYNDLWILNANENRITVYHSTIFQVLATGGLFGMFVLIYQFVCIGRIFKHNMQYKAVIAFLFTYFLSQAHGLIDNTQYMIHFSVVTYVTFALFENTNQTPEIEPSELYQLKKPEESI